jgi:DNA repair exonuclease SbcCD ATPase subunit
MPDKNLIINADIQLIDDENVAGEAFASVSLNPMFQWAKIVVTDDLPNANRQRIPQEEYTNLIKTGINAPIKMAEKGISNGHSDAFGHPIGVISQLNQEQNRLIALAALWKTEREEDVNYLKDLFKSGNPPQVSWEISYSESEVGDDGIETLHGTVLTGLAVVGMPAYAGRTPFVAMSSKNNDAQETEMEELEQLKAQVAELQAKITEAENALAEYKTALEAKETELASLREYKETKEKIEAEASRLAEIKNRFVEAGIEKDEAFYTEKKETLLGMSETALDFFIQEMVAFASKNAQASVDGKVKVPNLQNEVVEIDTSDPKQLGRALRELNK